MTLILEVVVNLLSSTARLKRRSIGRVGFCDGSWLLLFNVEGMKEVQEAEIQRFDSLFEKYLDVPLGASIYCRLATGRCGGGQGGIL